MDIKYKTVKKYSDRFKKYHKGQSIDEKGNITYKMSLTQADSISAKGTFEEDFRLLIEELKEIKDHTKISTAALEGFISEYISYSYLKAHFDPGKVDKQHWIPVTYLKGFAHQPDLTKDLYRLCRINSITSKLDTVSLDSDFRTKKDSKDFIYSHDFEKFFSVIEGDYGTIRNYWNYFLPPNNGIVNGLTKHNPISGYEKIILSIFAASLFIRTKDNLEKIQKRNPGMNSHDFFYTVLLKICLLFANNNIFYYFSNNSLFTSQNPVLSFDNKLENWYFPVHTNLSIFFINFEPTIGNNTLSNLSQIMQERLILESGKSFKPYLYGNANIPIFSKHKKSFPQAKESEIDYPISSWKLNYPKI